MNRYTALIVLPLLALAGCNSASAPEEAEKAKSAAVSRPDERLPDGFTLYVGTSGARDFSIQRAGTGEIATWAVVAKPQDVTAFYEAQAVAAGFTVVGRVSAEDYYSVDTRRDGDGRPRTISVTTSRKDEYATVAFKIDTTP